MLSTAGSVVRVQAPARLVGELRVPGDKSISHRALLLSALATGAAELRGLAPGDDVRSTARCLRALGVGLAPAGARPDAPWESGCTVTGVGLEGLREPEDVLDCGNSGTTIRLLSGILAGALPPSALAVLTGDASLRGRPMGRVIAPLRQMGADLRGRAGDRFAPLVVRGAPLRGTVYRSPVASAQVKSAVLLAGLRAAGPTTVIEPAPSRDHTERLLAAMGVSVAVDGPSVTVTPPARLRPVSLTVPGDFSSAAFWLVAALVHPNARITVRGVGLNPTRTGLLDVLAEMGARISVERRGEIGGEPVGDLTASSSDLRGVEVGGALVPRLIDELPVLAVAAAVARGTTRLRDAEELRYKESDRLHTVALGLARLGATVREERDGLEIAGGRLQEGAVESFGDHRLAMSLAVAGLAAGAVTVAGAEAVTVSYPGFWDDLAALGARVSALTPSPDPSSAGSPGRPPGGLRCPSAPAGSSAGTGSDRPPAPAAAGEGTAGATER